MVLITCNGIQREVAEADLQRWLEKGYSKVENNQAQSSEVIDAKKLADMKVPELDALAAEKGVEFPSDVKNKDQKVEFLSDLMAQGD